MNYLIGLELGSFTRTFLVPVDACCLEGHEYYYYYYFFVTSPELDSLKTFI